MYMENLKLPTSSTATVRTRHIRVNDLNLHLLEALPAASGSGQPTRLVVLLHGFPELSYSWRQVLVPLSEAGYHVVAPDQRGYGRTSIIDDSRGSEASVGQRVRFEDDLSPFRIINVVKDVVSLVYTLGYDSVAAVVGHDFGSLVAGYCSLIRPDIFHSVVMMSAPFPGAPPLPGRTGGLSLGGMATFLQQGLAALEPPRKHYTLYFSSPEANDAMSNPPEGLRAFFRDYLIAKSANWEGNHPHTLPSPTPAHLATMPHYYIMNLDETMPEAIRGCLGRRNQSNDDSDVTLSWLPDEELDIYIAEYSRTGFQGGLNWYRCMTEEKWNVDLQVFSGKKITVPAMFISGKQDWGTYQSPGIVEHMKENICEKMENEDFILIDGAGHWVQQEQSSAVVNHLLRFLGKIVLH